MDEWNRYALVLDYRWSQDLATVDGIKNNIMLSVYASSSQELLCSVLLIVYGNVDLVAKFRNIPAAAVPSGDGAIVD
jgi:hypothetical protein